VRDLWRQWWIGDGRREIPPLRYIDLEDVRHIDKKPVSAEERHGRRGKHIEKRRAAVKILSDMNYIIKFIRSKLERKNMWFQKNEPVTQRKVNQMFAAVNEEFMVNNRDVQKSWITVVRQLRNANRRTAQGNDDSDSDSDIL
jgi:hypothetical protein